MIFRSSTKKLCLGDLSICVAGSLVSRAGFCRFLGLICGRTSFFQISHSALNK